MSRTTEVLSISLSPKEFNLISKLAQKEGRSRSQLIREALRQYQISCDWHYLQGIGERVAIRLGIETEEDVERIAG
ncbi:MAG: hypothetical protein US31_C0001G0011 [Berkelbacteria bacterium GW2011_GWA1_36_9]|uniref:Ribbon-helix-helix protein CopG domain-containing protein n=1 Tax=Berkelbacteria bacterium GW2011_GWA1_36_9 TaxID=1618331 RepID=A0A0G0I3H2_9BACT|nr:MAG: hypothetical protein US31_C0001G0011 [Berkelbacteria bacterium GW2011_GWA1_36_9]